MTYGLEVLNTTGDVVIDAGFRNFEVIAEGTVVHDGTGLTYSVGITFTATQRPPLIFARVPGGTIAHVACMTLAKDAGGLYTSATLKTTDPYGTQGAFGIDWIAAAPADALSGDTWGLHVYGADGLKVFDSGERYVRIEDAVMVDLADFLDPLNYSEDSASAIPYTHASVPGAYYCLNALRALLLPGAEEVPPAIMHPAVRLASATQTNIALIDEAIFGNWSPDPYDLHPVPLILATVPP